MSSGLEFPFNLRFEAHVKGGALNRFGSASLVKLLRPNLITSTHGSNQKAASVDDGGGGQPQQSDRLRCINSIKIMSSNRATCSESPPAWGPLTPMDQFIGPSVSCQVRANN